MATAPLTYLIYYKTLQTDAWTAADADLFLDSIKFAAAPGTPTASLSREYGYLRRDAGTGIVAPLDLRGKWLKITITDSTKSQDWYGYCPTQTDSIGGTHKSPADGTTDVPSGRTTYQAFGMDFFLRSYEVDRCYFQDDLGTVQLLRRVLAFNTNSRLRNSQLVGRRTQTKPTGLPHVHDIIGTDQWTALDAVEHLLYTFKQVSGLDITLAGQHASLANIIEPWGELSGSYFQALTALINPARGFTWHLDNLTLYVVSVSDVAIGSYIPANPNIITLDLTSSGRIGDATITNLENVHYDKIMVRGERVRVCFTMKKAVSGNTLTEGWATAKETAYKAAADTDRAKEDYDPVYCRFILTQAWRGMAGTAVAVPTINTATGLGVFSGSAGKIFRPELLLDKSIPIFDDDENAVEGKQEKKVQVWYVDADGKRRRATKPDDDDLKSCSVVVLDDAPGFQLKPKYPHYFGLNHFTSTPASKNTAKVDWETLRATVSLYLDEHTRVEVSAQEPEPGELEKVKIIDVPDCHLWYVIDGTTTDATEDAWVTQSGNLITRNDTAILQRIAALAQVWYGRSRAAITVQCSTPFIWDRVGYVVSSAYAGGSAPTPAGTLVTSIEYDLNRLTSTLRTEWFDLDLSGLVKRRGGHGHHGRAGGEAYNCQIADDAVGGGGGGGGSTVYHCKLTAKVSDDTYTGSLYANGLDATATETGVTIRVAGMAAGSTLPNNIPFHAHKEKWAGADAWTLIGVPRWL